MAVEFTTPSTEASVSPATTVTNSLPNGSEGTTFTLENNTNKALYYKIRLSLASLTPTGAPSISLVEYGPNTTATPSSQRSSNQGIGGKTISVQTLTTTAEAKSVEFLHIVVPPFGMKYSFINSCGVTWPSSGNDVLVQYYGEENA